MRWLVIASGVFFVAGCSSAPADPDAAGTDAREDARPARCVGDDECSDESFCNGRERCEPTSATADARGCVASRGRPCLDAQLCDESTDTCTTDCGVTHDADGDGADAAACGGRDCDDADALAYPGATEVCDDEDRDEDCDPRTFGSRDLDRDGAVSSVCCNVSLAGVRTCGDDCNDVQRGVRPTATETCNGRDDDCNGATDEGVTVPGFTDADRDLHGDPSMARSVCPADVGSSVLDDDCDDTSVAAHRAQVEICDALDNDCDGVVDEHARAVTWYRDSDGDGFGSATSGTMVSCVPIDGYSLLPTDCADDNPSISPLAAERCNGLDDDCNGLLDGSASPGDFEDDDGDGHLDAACGGDDCDDLDWNAYAGAPEICDFRDSDCDGLSDLGRTPPAGAMADTTDEVDWYADVDQDGWGAGTAIRSCEPQPGRTTRASDCADEDLSRHPGAHDACDGRDDDCDPEIDEDAVQRAYYADGDHDGDGAGAAMLACRAPTGTSALPGDCADTNPARGPTAIETCNHVDDDCDTRVDEALFRDGDGDGHGDPAAPVTGACVAGDTGLGDDCNDGDPLVGPSGTCAELCNGLDDDRDAAIDEGAAASCPNVDTTRWACTDGACSFGGCLGAGGDCNGTPGDGCEIDTGSSSLHCGSCSTACDVGAACTTGSCDDPIVDVRAGTDHTMALRRSGNVIWWGDPSPSGAEVATSSGTATDVPRLSRAAGAIGLEHRWGRGCVWPMGGGAPLCWGNGSCGTTITSILGDGRRASTTTPAPLAPTGIAELGLGVCHTCAARTDGTVICWGAGSQAAVGPAMGDGSGAQSDVPVQVVGLDDAEEVEAGYGFSCARRASGRVICWGLNATGQLGDGTTSDRSSPLFEVLLASTSLPLEGATAVAVTSWGAPTQESGAACALLADHTVACWGYGSEGQLGRGTTSSGSRAAPVIAGTGTSAPLGAVAELHASARAFCAVHDDRSVSCWGSGTGGILGNGATTDLLAPARVPLPGPVSRFTMGGFHACALLMDGRVLCWGDNSQYQCAQPTTADVLVPTEVATLRVGAP